MGYDLHRFVTAQDRDYQQALSEIRRGRKTSHWIWYIFPQLKGLGFSSNASFYGIEDLGEAAAYLAHPVLGPRLVEISRTLLQHAGKDAQQIMGSPDHMKLRSSMTLFAQVDGADAVFQEVLDQFFEGEADRRSLELLTK